MNRSAPPPRGHTLPEVLVASTILIMFLTGIGSVFVRAFRTTSFGTDRGVAYRSAALAVDQIANELRMCERIYAPDASAMVRGVSLTSPLVFVRYDATMGTRVPVMLRLSSATSDIQRVIYSPDSGPSTPTGGVTGTWIPTSASGRVNPGAFGVGAGVRDARVLLIRNASGQAFLQLDVTCAPAPPSTLNLRTSVQVRAW